MSGARCVRSLFLLLALLLFPFARWVRAQGSDELTEQLEEWLQEPLDLSTATSDELAMLPWLDMGLATAIVSLRELGGLGSLEDLDRIAGMDPARRAALTPFVTLDAPAHDTQIELEGRTRWKRGSPSPRRSRLTLKRDRLEALAQREEGAESSTRGAVSVSQSWGTLVLGDFRPSLPWPLLLSNPSLRSRTASPSLSSGSHLRPRVSSAAGSWRGGGIEVDLAAWHLLLASSIERRDSTRPFLVLVEHRFTNSRRSTLGLALRDGSEAGLSLGVNTGPLSARFEWVRGLAPVPAGSGRVAAALRLRHGPLRWDLALTQAAPSSQEGQDPITGQTLDREHRVVQTSGRLSHGGWTLAALTRQRLRGEVGGVELSQRWQVEAAGPLAEARFACRLRVDEEPQSPSSLTLHASWRERDASKMWARELRVRHQRDGVASATLLALALQRGASWSWRCEWAMARGDRSSPWTVGAATAGLSNAWLSPGDSGLFLGLARRGAAGSGAFYLRIQTAEQGSPEFSGGLGLSFRLRAPP